jgi:uncharacterized phage-associated protein
MNDVFSSRKLPERISGITTVIKKAIERETGTSYDPRLIEASVTKIVERSLDRFEESLPEIFTSPQRPEFQELARMLETVRTYSLAEEESVAAVENVFAGNRIFSKEKLAAMIRYLTARQGHIYKTSLNKLLFYSDLTAFYLRGLGISGAVYFNRPYGPVADEAGQVLSELIDSHLVGVEPRTQSLKALADPSEGHLTAEEKTILDWVADTYGAMSASEISEISHDEKAYKFTRPNEPIAYSYGKFLNKLPPPTILE